MKITVEMTEEEFAEYLKFRKAKKINENRLAHILSAMNKLANTILEAVDFKEPQDEYEVDDDQKLNEAVVLANEWFAWGGVMSKTKRKVKATRPHNDEIDEVEQLLKESAKDFKKSFDKKPKPKILEQIKNGVLK